jgi:hypothetical protein
MTDKEFGVFVEAANNELEDKRNALGENYGMGTFSRWYFDQETKKLQFFDEHGRLALEANALDIGSYSPKPNTWI